MAGRAKRQSADADTSRNGVLAVPAKDTPGFDDVHFVVVELHDPAGKFLDRALYWRSKNGPEVRRGRAVRGAERDADGAVEVKTSAAKTADGRQVVTATLTNPTPHLAFFTRLKIVRGSSQTLVQPTEYSDDYFSLLPHETKTVTLTYDPSDLGGEPAKLSVEGWNMSHADAGLECVRHDFRRAVRLPQGRLSRSRRAGPSPPPPRNADRQRAGQCDRRRPRHALGQPIGP